MHNKLIALVYLSLASSLINADPLGALPGHSGIPGQADCSACHLGSLNNGSLNNGSLNNGALNDTLPALEINLPDEPVRTGTRQLLTFRLSHQDMKVAGLQLSVRSGVNGRQSAGTLVPDDLLAVSRHNDLVYLTHRRPLPADDGVVTFNVHWVAPMTEGKVIVNVAILAGNQDDSPLGDSVVVAEESISVISDQDAFGADHFEFESYGVPLSFMQDVQARLENNYQRILGDLNVSNLPHIKVRGWHGLDAFKAARAGASGTHEPASFYTDDGGTPVIGFLYTPGMDLAEVLHQFTHIVTLRVNPDLQSASRWLWESVALYEARQFFSPTQLSCVSLSDAPALGWLNVPANHETLRRVGYLLGDFLFNEYETETLAALLQAPGDLPQILAVSESTFERNWHSFVANRYLSAARIPSILSDIQISQQVVGNTFYFEDGRTLYLDENHGVTIAQGEHVQTGVWTIEARTRVCWQVLNFDSFCTRFRMTGRQFWLDTLSDCQRYSLRRETGNVENY